MDKVRYQNLKWGGVESPVDGNVLLLNLYQLADSLNGAWLDILSRPTRLILLDKPVLYMYVYWYYNV